VITLRATATLCLLATAGWGSVARAQPSPFAQLGDDHARAVSNELPQQLEEVGVDEHLLRNLPGGATFRDHTGRTVHLRDYFDGRRPVVLNLAYYSCPVLCGMIQQAASRSLKEQPWTIGREYQVVTISIDPRDTPATARTKRATVLRQYGRPEAARGWAFLTGDEANIRRVARAVGFRYTYDARQQNYAHPAVIMLATPDGKIARYLYGLDFDPQDVRIGLLEASQGRSISSVEHILLYCYRYDPNAQGYVVVAMHVMQIGGALTILVLGGFLFFLWRRELRRRRERLSPSLVESRA
jgi:protein SCO1/2